MSSFPRRSRSTRPRWSPRPRTGGGRRPAAPPRPRRAGPPASQPVSPAPPAAAPAAEPPRPAVQEIVSPAETKRLQEQAQGRRREVKQILDQLDRRSSDRRPERRGRYDPEFPHAFRRSREAQRPAPGGRPRRARPDSRQGIAEWKITSTKQRRQAVADELPDRKLDCLLVAFSPNLRYLSGFTGSNGALLILPEAKHPVHRSALPDPGGAGIHLQDPHLPRGRWWWICWPP